MTTTDPNARHWTDRINPVVVKELRQAVRDGTTAAILLGFLAAMLLVLAARCVMITRDGGVLDENTGRQTASVMVLLLVVVATLALPIQSAIRLHAEASGEQLGMMLVTRVSYHGVFWGKVWVTMIKFALIACTVLPFVTVTMLMRGVSLPAVTWAVMVCGLACFGATIAAMSVAALPDGLVGRFVAAIGGGGVLAVLFFAVWGVTHLVVAEGSGPAIVGSLVSIIALGVVGFFFNLVTYSLAAQKRGRFNRYYYRPPTADAMREYQRAMFEQRQFHQPGAPAAPPTAPPPLPSKPPHPNAERTGDA